MRFYWKYLLAACFITGAYNKTAVGQSVKNVNLKVVIEFEDFATSTFEPVSCDFFEAAFHESLRKVVVKDAAELKLFNSYCKGFVPVSEIPQSFDVRAKICISCNGRTEEYCVNRLGIFQQAKKKTYFKNDKLFKYIKKKCLPPNMQDE